jgi:hypothetical protein
MFRASALAMAAAGAVAIGAIGATASAQDARPQIAQAPAAAAVLATAQYSADPDLRCDLLEVKRISGGALMIRWRIVNAAGQANASSTGGFANPTPAKPIHYYFSSWDALNYIDPAENKKYLPLTDSANNRILDVFGDVTLEPGQQRLNWAKFPAPPPGSAKISVSIPNFAPFEDAPVAQ